MIVVPRDSMYLSRQVKTLRRSLQAQFDRSQGASLAPRRAYQVALRRATIAVGGRATGSHAHRRTSALDEKNARYRNHPNDGKTPKDARQLAIQDTVEHLGHSRNRRDLAAAYLGKGVSAVHAECARLSTHDWQENTGRTPTRDCWNTVSIGSLDLGS